MKFFYIEPATGKTETVTFLKWNEACGSQATVKFADGRVESVPARLLLLFPFAPKAVR